MDPANTTLWASVPGTALRSSATRACWRWRSGRISAIGAREADALEVCAPLQPQGAHVQRLARDLRIDTATAQSLLRKLAADGLLVELGAWLASCAAGDDGAAPLAGVVPPPLLVVRSYERPQGLQPLLDSLIENEQRHGLAHRLLVVDDSPSPMHCAVAREQVRIHATRTRGEVRFLGHEERSDLLAHVFRGLDAPVRDRLLPLLCPHHPTAVTGSRAWNWAVLAAAGGTLSILDDDVRLPLAGVPGSDLRVDLAPSLDTATRYLDPGEDDGLQPLSVEPYAWLSRWLAQRPGALIRRDGCHGEALAGRTLDDLVVAAADAPVVGVVPGLRGSLAFDSSAYLTCTDAGSMRDLWRSPFRLERLQADRLWQGVPRPRLVGEAVYTPLLLDARAMLPFAGTWGRVDDQYFLMLLRAIASPVTFALVPALLGHGDHHPRRRLERAREPLLLDRNAWLAFEFARITGELGGGDRIARLHLVGAHCAALATLDDPDLRRRILEWRGNMMLQLVAWLNMALDRHPGAPPAWREHAAQVVATNTHALAHDTIADDELARYRAGLRQVADAAPAWPGIWQRVLAEPIWDRLPVAS